MYVVVVFFIRWSFFPHSWHGNRTRNTEHGTSEENTIITFATFVKDRIWMLYRKQSLSTKTFKKFWIIFVNLSFDNDSNSIITTYDFNSTKWKTLFKNLMQYTRTRTSKTEQKLWKLFIQLWNSKLKYGQFNRNKKFVKWNLNHNTHIFLQYTSILNDLCAHFIEVTLTKLWEQIKVFLPPPKKVLN